MKNEKLYNRILEAVTSEMPRNNKKLNESGEYPDFVVSCAKELNNKRKEIGDNFERLVDSHKKFTDLLKKSEMDDELKKALVEYINSMEYYVHQLGANYVETNTLINDIVSNKQSK